MVDGAIPGFRPETQTAPSPGLTGLAAAASQALAAGISGQQRTQQAQETTINALLQRRQLEQTEAFNRARLRVAGRAGAGGGKEQFTTFGPDLRKRVQERIDSSETKIAAITKELGTGFVPPSRREELNAQIQAERTVIDNFRQQIAVAGDATETFEGLRTDQKRLGLDLISREISPNIGRPLTDQEWQGIRRRITAATKRDPRLQSAMLAQLDTRRKIGEIILLSDFPEAGPTRADFRKTKPTPAELAEGPERFGVAFAERIPPGASSIQILNAVDGPEFKNVIRLAVRESLLNRRRASPAPKGTKPDTERTIKEISRRLAQAALSVSGADVTADQILAVSSTVRPIVEEENRNIDLRIRGLPRIRGRFKGIEPGVLVDFFEGELESFETDAAPIFSGQPKPGEIGAGAALPPELAAPLAPGELAPFETAALAAPVGPGGVPDLLGQAAPVLGGVPLEPGAVPTPPVLPETLDAELGGLQQAGAPRLAPPVVPGEAPLTPGIEAPRGGTVQFVRNLGVQMTGDEEADIIDIMDGLIDDEDLQGLGLASV